VTVTTERCFRIVSAITTTTTTSQALEHSDTSFVLRRLALPLYLPAFVPPSYAPRHPHSPLPPSTTIFTLRPAAPLPATHYTPQTPFAHRQRQRNPAHECVTPERSRATTHCRYALASLLSRPPTPFTQQNPHGAPQHDAKRHARPGPGQRHAETAARQHPRSGIRTDHAKPTTGVAQVPRLVAGHSSLGRPINPSNATVSRACRSCPRHRETLTDRNIAASHSSSSLRMT
jgi:hypothetical protein